MTQKQEAILAYIEQLPMGEKISVRKISKIMMVSEGTAYRAIKEAKDLGLVATVERVGTIRLKDMKEDVPEWLTLDEVLCLVKGQIVCGKRGMKKTLSSFAIAAMQVKSMRRFLRSNTLIIVGNRQDVHEFAIENKMPILITGGTLTDIRLIQTAEEQDVPIISTQYDTFTVAKILTEAITQHQIKKDLQAIDDFVRPLSEVGVLKVGGTVSDYYKIKQDFLKDAYTVIDKQKKIVGIVTQKDVDNQPFTQIQDVMNQRLTIATLGENAVQVYHRMLVNSLSELPVQDVMKRFVGMINKHDLRQAILKLEKKVQNHFSVEESFGNYKVTVKTDMVNEVGVLSHASIMELLSTLVETYLPDTANILEKVEFSYLNTIVLGDELKISSKKLRQNRLETILEIEISTPEMIMVYAILTIKNSQH